MTAIVCVGLAVHDVMFTVDRLPSGAGKTHAVNRVEMGGGPAANAAVAIATLGGDARFVGVLGEDRLGHTITAELEELDVDTTHVRRSNYHRSPTSSVTIDRSGERAIVNHTDPDLFAGAHLPSGQELHGASAVLVDVRWHEGARAGLRWARDQGVPGVVDYDLGDTDGPALAELASHVIFSSGALARLTGTQDPGDGLRTARTLTPAWLAVTVGERGTVWLEGDQPRHQPGYVVETVDTTGAGDVYHGVFALELARGRDEIEAMRSASAAAALACTRVGGRDGVPSRDELTRFLQEKA